MTGCNVPGSLGRHRVPDVGACPCGSVRRAPVLEPVARPYVITADGVRALLPVR